jgi:AraC family transcriptional activator of pobA
MSAPPIPRYFLFGERDEAVADRFIHIETIACRSGPIAWTIRPHSHAALAHILVVEDGGGEMQSEGRRVDFDRAILTIPAGAVHGFRFHPGTVGHVVTIAEPMMRALASGHGRLARLLSAAQVLPLVDAAAVGPVLAALAVETESSDPMASYASEALLQLLLVHAVRLMPDLDDPGAPPPRRPALLVARYRAQIDRHLRDSWSIADHARELGTSTPRLRAACVEVAGVAPIRILHERLIAEARRQLSYTDRTIIEIAYDLGFEDPAYFSRFFRRGAGTSPAAWRMAQAANASVSISSSIAAG